MCSIFGFSANAPDPEERARAFCDAMRHRGPDNETSRRVGPWVLGHQRLSIIDVSSLSNQPMQRGRSAIVLNGEIYNYKELREKYLSGVPLVTSSDTEVLLELLDRLGTRILNELNGMFAFGWYSEASRKLLLVRDRFGVKPLHWMADDGVFHFSSEIKPLIALKRTLEYEPRILRAFLVDTATDFDDTTFIAGINQVKPGHYLEVAETGSAREHRWYSGADYQFDDRVFRSHRDTLDSYEALLSDAIRLRHRSDVPVCITLSGGLDSTTIYTLAKERLDSKVKAFTFSHPGSLTDEVELVTRLTQRYDDAPSVITSRPENGIADLQEALEYLEFPTWSMSVIAYLDTYRAIRDRGFRVVIEGHGSDESLGGYPYMVDAACRESWLRGQIPRALALYKVYRQTLNPDVLQGGYSALSWLGLPRYVLSTLKHRNDWKRGLQALLDECFHFKVLPISLRNFDRLSMAASLESRSPFMDFRVVEFTRRLPGVFKVNSLGSKAILREILRKYGMDFIYRRRAKMVFAADLPAFFRVAENRRYLADRVSRFSLPEFADWKQLALANLQRPEVRWSDVGPIWKVAGLQMTFEMYDRSPVQAC